MTDEKETLLCTCDEGGKAKAAARLDRVRGYFKTPPSDLELVDRMLAWMTSLWMADITITGDQWYAVEYTAWRDPDNDWKYYAKKKRPVDMIMCDRPIDGIAYMFEKHYMKNVDDHG